MFEKRSIGLALVLPAALFVALGFLLPVGLLLAESFRTPAGWSLAYFTTFFADPLNQAVFLRTLRLGLTVTAVCLVVGYAAALAITGLGPAARGRFVGVLILPLMISPVARTYAWVVILGRTGLLNVLVLKLGLSDEPLRILFTETAVFLGLVQLFFPLAVLPLLSALENLPADVVPAARVLGASWLRVFWQIILPLTREGLVVGGTLVFVGSLTAYITPAMLGGSKVLMLETLLYQRVSVANDFVSAGVISVILIVMSIATNVLLRRLAAGRRAGGAHA
ncbi:ABC transporter permease [uncultured Alsobacter sp.]|uniref:ABC transporter permease n=1 Tax=uncultured Alsobacter sp. TaxID=1748258 RepID=UPI0025FEC4F4|nr:ABC transporter permease [uncultured Alsobacter sp.]